MRYIKAVRRFLIWLSYRVPDRIDSRIVEYLYPNDAVITFWGKEG